MNQFIRNMGVCIKCPNYLFDHSTFAQTCKVDGEGAKDHCLSSICPDTPSHFNLSPEELAALPQASPEVQPIPRDQWPEKVQKIAALAKPGEKGIGTVIARLIETNESRLASAAVIADEFGTINTMVGAFKWLVGAECGCGDKAARLDLLYPLP